MKVPLNRGNILN